MKVVGAAAGVAAVGGVGAPAMALARDRDRQPAPGAKKLPQGAGYYRFKLGDVEVSVISDGSFPFTPAHPTLAANATKEDVERALTREFIEYDKVMAQVNCLLIRTARDTVLMDAGSGRALGPNAGKLIENLVHAGVAAADISAVAISHMHIDHMTGLLDESGGPTFPNAELIIHKDEHAFWSDEHPDFSRSFLPANMRPGTIADAQRILAKAKFTLIEGEKEIRPRITVVPALGHTPGHIGLMIDGGGTNQLLYISDVVHHYAIQIAHPEYHVMFDVVPEQATETRKRMFDRAAADRLLVAGAHIPFPSVGHLRRQHASVGAGYDWAPVAWAW